MVVKTAVRQINVEGKSNRCHGGRWSGFRAPIIISGAGYINTAEHLLDPDAAHDWGSSPKARPLTAQPHTSLYVGCRQGSDKLRMPRSNHWIYPTDDHDHNVERYLQDRSSPLPVTYISFPAAKDFLGRAY